MSNLMDLPHLDLPHYITLPLGFLVGVLIGFGYFVALRETTALIVTQRSALLALALTLGRMGFLVTLLVITIFVAGGGALVATLAGLLCARILMLRRHRSEGT